MERKENRETKWGTGKSRKRNGLSVKFTSRGDVLLALMLPYKSASSDLADISTHSSSPH